ncbi:hypothetical protein [Flavisolibacter ginsengisoli]|jgi:hypothetical protein|uniref:Uncharacterized protein n=1 Tax=Flavisolibacter ginsengisoli DSM 18119 TaxID=1121884 RepID=A0A1M5F9E9_9BACT|nr:hypothetical protein [Flavisolibacter ginsengisoli]SHF88230.1 hypothetical protein SAMN02745131_03751 [Flavisolibacter ginsengisoli DSM 18119]
MAKQTGYIKATGKVDGDTNFYYDELWGYLVRMLPGVDSKRFWKDPAFEGSRRSAQRFGTGNIMSSIIYRFVPTKRRYRHLFKQVRTIAIVGLKQGMAKGEVFTALYNFLSEQKRISLTGEQFTLLLSSFEEELESRLKEPKREKEKEMKNKLNIKVEAPLTAEDTEYFQLYMEDYDWKIKFEGDFPTDYQIPLFLLKHVA